MSEPPPYPWKKGTHKDHRTFILEVTICVNEHNQVFSSHDLQDEQDRQVVADLPSGGLNQSAFALLQEAVRREANLQVLIKMSQEKEFQASLQDPATRDLAAQEFAKTIQEVMGKQIDQLALPSAQEMLNVVVRGGG